MSVVCSCVVLTCSREVGCPVQSFFTQAQNELGPLNPHLAVDEHNLRELFYAHTGTEDQSRCQGCWPLILLELQLIYDTGYCHPASPLVEAIA